MSEALILRTGLNLGVFVTACLAVLGGIIMMQNGDKHQIPHQLANDFGWKVDDAIRVYDNLPRNAQTTLRRQIVNTNHPQPERPVCVFDGENAFKKALTPLPPDLALFTLGRLYDEAHIVLCRHSAAAKKNQLHNPAFLRKPRVNVMAIAEQLVQDKELVNHQIILEFDKGWNGILEASWKPVLDMSFDHLQRLRSLSEMLPGEERDSREYAGIGGGGGSDIISASLLGRLLRRQKKEMDLLISTRTWATGSQGKAGSKMGVKREVYRHGGPAKSENGSSVPGTFLVTDDTHAEGRDLEAIPIKNHKQIFIVLDQGESKLDVPEQDKAELKDQFKAVLSQCSRTIDTILTVDTGGDVFGADTANTTPDQDLRVQRAVFQLKPHYNLVTAVMAPGVDAPEAAPQIAADAEGKVYTPTEEEKKMILSILVDEYKMDGSHVGRFGKTTLALQARLNGKLGWTSLDLPEYVIDTWENPWNSFVYIRKCMEDIILMPTEKLLPKINDPIKGFRRESWRC